MGSGSGLSALSPIYTQALDASGNVGGVLAAGTNRSGTATTIAAQLAPANSARISLTGQNVGANNIGINETGGTAVIGSAGTFTVAPGATFKISTNRAISVIAATAATAYTATET